MRPNPQTLDTLERRGGEFVCGANDLDAEL